MQIVAVFYACKCTKVDFAACFESIAVDQVMAYINQEN